MNILRHWLRLILITTIVFVTHRSPGAETKNAIVFLVDDLGWTDLGCFGSDFYETPNIDKLATEGVKFTSAYAACTVCSPTRAALLTGQNPARLHVTDFIPGHPFVNTPLTIPDWTKVLEHRHLTIPELLKPSGFQSVHLGKWHLTHRDRSGKGGTDNPDPEFYPESQGFDINIGGNEHGAPPSYFWPYGRGKTIDVRKQNTIFKTLPKGGGEGEYLTDRLAREGVRVLDEFQKNGSPFFMYFSFYNVHTPLMGRPDLLAKYEAKLKRNPKVRHNNVKYAAMVESVDEAVGTILTKLKDINADDSTMVIFTSDNGGLRPQATDNHPLRQGKGGIYEGGVRIPTIIKWPEKGAKGAECKEALISMDFLPTIMEALDVSYPDEFDQELLDGVSLTGLIENPDSTMERDAIYWHYPHYHSMGAQPYSAVLARGWKLIERHTDGGIELYNLEGDIHEDNNRAKTEEAITSELLSRLNDWRKSVGAQMPVSNKSYDEDKPTGVNRGNVTRPQVPIRE